MAEVYNQDVASLCRRIARYADEVHKARSNSVADMSEFDVARVVSYFGSLRQFHAWVMAQPQLDLPEWTPTAENLPDWADHERVENEAINDLVRDFHTLWFELVNSQSARVSTGLVEFDSFRFESIMDKMESFVSDYIQNVQPLDLPETTPSEEVSGPGRLGV